MTNMERLKELIRQQHGTVLSSDVDRNNIPRTYLRLLVTQGQLERIERGVYVSVDKIEDEMFSMQQRYPKLIYSHETALYLHGLSDRVPFQQSASVPSGYKAVGSVAERFKIYYIKKELHDLGEDTIQSPHGNPIRIYNIERTICDVIRSRNRIDVQIFTSALQRFSNAKKADFSVLMDYAKRFKIDAVLRNYLEVLL